MLLRFEVENFRSFRNPQELSFIATTLKGGKTDVLSTADVVPYKVLPCIVIYGANASGKSNTLTALAMMKSIVRFSHSKAGATDEIPYDPFLLDETRSKPTRFELDFVCDGVRRVYGFEYSAKRIEREWLYSYPKKRPRRMFLREGKHFEFGRELRGQNRVISELTRENSLFLSAGQQNNHSELTEIYNYIEGISFERSFEMNGGIAQARIVKDSNGKIDERVIRYLGDIGTGISDYQILEREETDETKKINSALHQFMKEIAGVDVEVPSMPMLSVQLSHDCSDGSKAYFPLDDESSGTLRLLSSLPKVFSTLDTGGVLVMDEVDLSLHTQAAASILKLFNSSVTNPNGAQLLTTTHDTNLLKPSCLRRDQVWFTDKARDGSSTLYPLSDFSTRETDDHEKGYLQGRFGAVPPIMGP